MGQAAQKISPFLMFFGQAEEAIQFYTSIFDDSRIDKVTRFSDVGIPVEPGNEQKVLHAIFTLKGQQFMCIDNLDKQHKHSFTPALSLFVSCDTEEELNRVFEQLSVGGAVLMSLAETPVSAKFGWVEDRYGVSWQLDLPK
ncbi:VOC family protein [Paenibacillus radicis (ex Gao et al. 2016)]|uniref:VOC family protein n=1 Tax=Paenibacillus radicis (ex Gao et al. 2016) TaxID=1737354 RepID=A0A917HI43_9BACL|nr:VOC family protein [Paenibacillus radicis (ex Gao et al. 2016)]GGG79359.1 VOC family protein [Paenibacillus radicis (ex Gao et al. 2016)]